MTELTDLERRVGKLENRLDIVDERLGQGAKTMAVLTEKVDNLNLTELKTAVKEINEKLTSLCLQVVTITAHGDGKNKLGEGAVKYSGWLLAIASFLYAVLK